MSFAPDDDDLRNDETFGADDAHNDDTFGAAADASNAAPLPNFFQHHGTTVLEELGHLGDEGEDDGDDDLLYESEAFGTGLSDFFKPGYNNAANGDAWMGGAGDALLEADDEDALDKELEMAQKELARFAIDPAMLDEPYKTSSVTISLSVSESTAPIAPAGGAAQSANKGRQLTPGELNSLLSGQGVGPNFQSAESVSPGLGTSAIAPPLFAQGARGGPSIAASLSGPTPVIPRPPAPGGPWNKPLPNFEDKQAPPPRQDPRQRGGRGWGQADAGSNYHPQRYGGRGAPPPRGPQYGPPPGHMHPGMNMPPPFPGGPPSFPCGPPPFPGGPPAFGPPSVPGFERGPYPPPLPHGEKMSTGEVRFVLSKVLDPLKMQDPYCDDFYAIQTAIKKNSEIAAAAAKNNTAPQTPPLHVPLPIWKVAKERLLQQLAASKQDQAERTVAWEKKEHVLGHVTRLDFSRPRQQLSFTAAPTDEEVELDTTGDTPKNCYGTVLWNMRVAVNRGFNALYTVQELHQLLNTPMIASNPEARADILNEVSSALSLLSRSVGILPQIAPSGMEGLEELAAGGSGTGEVVLEGGLVAALLQTIKGKKLISRSMRHLTATQRWALTPVILARTLQTVNAKSADGKHSEEELVEQRLMKVLVQFVQTESNLSEENMELGRIEFSVNLLKNLRQCVRTVMVAQMEKTRLREALLSSRYRAEVMHNIIQVGDKIAKALTEKNSVALQWSEIREAFMSMLDN